MAGGRSWGFRPPHPFYFRLCFPDTTIQNFDLWRALWRIHKFFFRRVLEEGLTHLARIGLVADEYFPVHNHVYRLIIEAVALRNDVI
jgi:hypothetical protein